MDVVDSQNIHVYNRYCKKGIECMYIDWSASATVYVCEDIFDWTCMSVCVYMYVYICMCMFVDKSGSDRGWAPDGTKEKLCCGVSDIYD